MKPAKTILIVHLALLFAFGYSFTGCSSGSNQQDNTANATPSKKAIDEDVEEEEDEEEEKKEESSDVYANWKDNKGIGPVKSLVLPAEIDQAMADEGAKIYKEKCSSCHKPDKRFIGPTQKGVLDRRTPEWVMNMILNPEQMVKEDPMAKQLLMDYNLSPMANQNLTEADARKVLEYIRTL